MFSFWIYGVYRLCNRWWDAAEIFSYSRARTEQPNWYASFILIRHTRYKRKSRREKRKKMLRNFRWQVKHYQLNATYNFGTDIFTKGEKFMQNLSVAQNDDRIWWWLWSLVCANMRSVWAFTALFIKISCDPRRLFMYPSLNGNKYRILYTYW